jgi:FMN phosphatase YigB (HAD superfamily)
VSSKPNIEIYLETLRQLKLTDKDVENILFIGDNPYTDTIGAKKIGFKRAWIKMDGNNYPDDLSPPNYTIEGFRELEI